MRHTYFWVKMGWVPPYLAFFKCIHFSRGKKYGRVLEKKLKNSLSNPRWQMSSYFSVTLIHSIKSCFPYKLRNQLHYLASYLQSSKGLTLPSVSLVIITFNQKQLKGHQCIINWSVRTTSLLPKRLKSFLCTLLKVN